MQGKLMHRKVASRRRFSQHLMSTQAQALTPGCRQKRKQKLPGLTALWYYPVCGPKTVPKYRAMICTI